jgi:Mg-chelatase subunit ChlD
MRIRDFFKGKRRNIPKQVSRPCTPSREEKILRLQRSFQSPYKEERRKALKELQSMLAPAKRQIHSHGTATVAIERLVLVLDRSDSMGTPDYPPTRLDAAIEAAQEMIQIRAKRDPRDQVGIVWFNGTAQVLVEPVCLQKGKGHLTRALSVLSP